MSELLHLSFSGLLLGAEQILDGAGQMWQGAAAILAVACIWGIIIGPFLFLYLAIKERRRDYTIASIALGALLMVFIVIFSTSKEPLDAKKLLKNSDKDSAVERSDEQADD